MKLYISPCPNDTFMFDAIINKRIDTQGFDLEVEYHDIEELNARALQGEADFSKISCAILPHINNTYQLMQSGAALGRGNGPLLVRRKGDTTPLKHIATPGVYTTANALTLKLFPEIEKRTPMLFSQIAEAVERGDFDGGVLIHEGRFVYQNRNLELVADLGILWEQRMQLPLPLGGIVAKKSLDPELISRFEELLRQSIEFAFANPSASRDFIKSHAQELDDKVIDSHIALFVNHYSLNLGSEGEEAVLALSSQ